MTKNSNSQSGPHKRQRKTCECGRTFLTTAKFGNETKCTPCYRRSDEEFYAWYESQPIEAKREMLAELKAIVKDLGIEVPEEVKEFEEEEALQAKAAAVEELPPEQRPHADQDAIDAAFAALLADLDF